MSDELHPPVVAARPHASSAAVNYQQLDQLPLRDQLQGLEADTESLKTRLKKLIKVVGTLANASQTFDEASKQFADEILNFGQASVNDEAQDLFIRLGDVLRDLVYKQAAVVKLQESAIVGRLKQYVDVTINGTMNMQSKVDDARRDYESSTEKLHALKKKPTDKQQDKVTKAEQDETKNRQQFDLLTFQYATKMKELLQDVQYTLMDGMTTYIKEKLTYFKSGHALLKKLEPEMKTFANKASTVKKSMEESRLDQMVRNMDEKVRTGNLFTDVEKQFKQGYLWIKSKKGKWNKSYVSVINGRLLYYKSWKNMTPKGSFNLVLCSVKRATDANRANVIELRSNMNDSLLMHANDENDMKQWLEMIQSVIATQLNAGMADKEVKVVDDSVVTDELLRVRGNEVCADCGKPDPEWAVLDHGITICIECSGVHRSLGTHISKVRSLKLDTWEPEVVLLMKSIGNSKANGSVYEETLPDGVKIGPTAERIKREAFIKAKYVEKKYVDKLDKEKIEETLQTLMKKKRSVGAVALLKLIAQGADVNWHNPKDRETLLHKCAEDGNIVGIELLLKAGAKIDELNASAQAPLHVAAIGNHAGVVRLLLHHGASVKLTDANGKTADQLASENSSADCLGFFLPEEEQAAASVSLRQSGSVNLELKRTTSTALSGPGISMTPRPKGKTEKKPKYRTLHSGADVRLDDDAQPIAPLSPSTLKRTKIIASTSSFATPATTTAPPPLPIPIASATLPPPLAEPTPPDGISSRPTADDLSRSSPTIRRKSVRDRKTMAVDRSTMDEQFLKFQQEFTGASGPASFDVAAPAPEPASLDLASVALPPPIAPETPKSKVTEVKIPRAKRPPSGELKHIPGVSPSGHEPVRRANTTAHLRSPSNDHPS